MTTEHTPESTSLNAPSRSRPRTSPIIWGLIFLAVCAWIAQQVLFPDLLAPQIWIAGIVLGLGAVLLTVGIVVAIRGSSRRDHTTPNARP